MVFADWTFSGTGSASLDASVKQAGNSSAKINLTQINGTNGKITHNTFNQLQASIILYMRISYIHASCHSRINHSSYGNLNCVLDNANEFQKFRCKFWYDIGDNIKWGRIEKWIDGAWVQQGTDTSFGTGSPSSGAIALCAYSYNPSINVWFDEVEVSA